MNGRQFPSFLLIPRDRSYEYLHSLLTILLSSHTCIRIVERKINMISFAFRYLLPAPGPVSVQPLRKSKLNFLARPLEKQDDPSCVLSIIFFAFESRILTHSFPKRTK